MKKHDSKTLEKMISGSHFAAMGRVRDTGDRPASVPRAVQDAYKFPEGRVARFLFSFLDAPHDFCSNLARFSQRESELG